MRYFKRLADVNLRPQQQKIIDLFNTTDKKYLVIEMSTGGGKSISGMTCAEITLNDARKK